MPDLAALRGVESVSVRDGTVTVVGSSVALQTVLTALSGRDVIAEELRVATPTLDDAYLRAARAATREGTPSATRSATREGDRR